jgi:superfamily II DNA or RNA helicase
MINSTIRNAADVAVPSFFAVVIHKHRFLGWIFSAHRMAVNPKNNLLLSVEQLLPESFRPSDKHPCTDAEMHIVKITGSYSDNQLLNLFKKQVKSLPELFKLANTNREAGDYVRNYIEQMMLKVFDLVAANHIPVYLRDDRFSFIFNTSRLEFVAKAAEPVFEYELADKELRYRLSATCGEDAENLKLLHAQVICTDPCLLRIEKKVYKIPSISGKQALPFLSKPYITVPEKAIRKYMETFVLNSIYSRKVIAKGFRIKTLNPLRRVILSLEERLSGGWAFFLRLGYGDEKFLYASPPNAKVSLEEKNGDYCFCRFERDPEWEKQQVDMLLQSGLINNTAASEFVPDTGYDQTIYSLIGWVNDHITVLQERQITVEQQPDGKNRYYVEGSDLSLFGDQKADWFNIYGKVKFADYEIPFLHFRHNIMSGEREFVLPDKRIFLIPDSWFTKYKALFMLGKASRDNLQLPRVFFGFLEDTGIKTPDIDALRQRFSASRTDGIAMPAGLKASLRNYQKEGLIWLKILHNNRMGGCLADDMGLGKTLQALAFFQLLKEARASEPVDEQKRHNRRTGHPDGRSKTILVVVPTSIVHNWLRETERFTPGMQVCLFIGSQRTRNVETLMQYDLVITTYGVVRNDIALLKEAVFNYIVLDESQIIKNPKSKIYHSVLLLKAGGFLTLSGTPIENSVIDLWAQLNFLNRGMLGSLNSFREKFVIPVEKTGDSPEKLLLKKMIEPFVLRRKKEDVAKDLPAITEQVVYCEMTDAQSDIYEREKSAIRNMILENIGEQGYERSAICILRGLTRLRQIASHPVMIYTKDQLEAANNGVIPLNPAELAVDTDRSGESTFDSGKFEEITRSLDNIISEGHKVLVFSSFVKHLNLVAAYLEESGTNYRMLTGNTANRKEIVDKFQHDENIPVFLLSLKAGGVGLNLTAADYILILDPWWNPAVESQAVSRAHRIGQEKHIFVYRFISVGTVEEKILRLQERKELLSKNFVESVNPLQLLGEQNLMDLLT